MSAHEAFFLWLTLRRALRLSNPIKKARKIWKRFHALIVPDGACAGAFFASGNPIAQSENCREWRRRRITGYCGFAKGKLPRLKLEF